MKQFFKFMFASMLGFILAGFLICLISFFIIVGIVSNASNKTVTTKDNSILELKFDQPIKERGSKDPFENLNFFQGKHGAGLNDILKNIAKAKEDPQIRGIFLNTSNLQAGLASIEEIRTALIDFKKSKKFICAYSEMYSQSNYYLASVADKIYLQPQGGFDMRGLHLELTFFKKLLAKLEVEPEVIRHGKFKSAVEPLINEKMSPENRIQLSTLLNSIWDRYVAAISESRHISEEEVRSIAADMKVKFPEDALHYKLVDALAYYDEVQTYLRAQTGLKENEKIRLVELKKYDRTYNEPSVSGKKKIAVIYAVGEIRSGEGDDEEIGSDRIASAIQKARRDTSIKAIVLRVNSPGGSALASDVIWREVVLAKQTKPVVVSMGNYAASGGYYIACGADKIVAQPNTITGSIGVFGILMNAQKLFEDKLGVTFDTVKTGKYSDLGSITRPITAEERAIVQSEVEKVYDTFISHVAEGRKISKATVDSLGQGRVWSGTDAKDRGLVDELGGISVAIGEAAKLAKIDKYRIVELPEQKDLLKKLVEDFSTEAHVDFAQKNLGEYYKYYQQAQNAFRHTGVLTRMEATMEIY